MKLNKCKSCGKDFVFLLTEKGKRIPVNPETVENGAVFFDREKHVAHFATCDDPKRFRKRDVEKAKSVSEYADSKTIPGEVRQEEISSVEK